MPLVSSIKKQFSEWPIAGAMVIAGTAIGAGMFSIPVVSAGMWYGWSVVVILLSWFVMFHSGLMILEVNLKYPVGSSFDTIVKASLGPVWNAINGFAVAFVLYTVTYAYVSGGGSVIRELLSSADIELPTYWASLIFALSFAALVWMSTSVVSRVASIMLGGMIISFLLSISSLFGDAKMVLLFDTQSIDSQYFPYLFAALPFFLTSFGFHGNVPSLMKHYGKNPKLIVRCLSIGSLLTLVVYLLWQTSVLGNIGRSLFSDIISRGGNIGVLISVLGDTKQSALLSTLLGVFSNLAVASSFIGVSLGLFDYIADKFNFTDNSMGRLKTAGITFMPPIVFSLIYPDGFLYAIAYAGLGAAVFGVIVPAKMVLASRRQQPEQEFRVWGGRSLAYGVMAYGGLVIICHVLAMLNFLPSFH